MLFILGLLIYVNGFSQENIEKKIEKEFPADKNTEFFITHKYGDITFENWNEDKVFIEAIIIAKTDNQEKADKLFNKVDVVIKSNKNIIDVKSVFNSKKIHSKIEIKFIVKIPNYLILDISNKFGSVFLNETSGKLNIHLAYGNLKARKLLNKSKENMNSIDIAFGEADINECYWLKLDAEYSTIEIEKVKSLIFDTRFSELEIEDCNTLAGTSKYDSFDIGNANNIVLDAQFSDFEIDIISNKLELDSEYGDFEVGNFSAGFELIRIDNDFGDIDIEIDENASYHLSAKCDFCDVEFNSNNSVNTKESTFSNNYKGNVGSDKNTKSKIIVKSSYGDVELD